CSPAGGAGAGRDIEERCMTHERETQLIRWPKCATERAMLSVIANWHIAGALKQLRSDKKTPEAA
ncbi:MAG: hypothetical protein ACTHXB_07245, partial [Luteimonas sp.]